MTFVDESKSQKKERQGKFMADPLSITVWKVLTNEVAWEPNGDGKG